MTELEPLYTAEEMKAAEAGHDVEALMERAGGAVAAAVARDYPGARVVAVCGKGANGGDGRIAAHKLGAEVVEIVGRPKPGVELSGRLQAWAERVGAGVIDLSMSHSRELATAVAVAERGPQNA